MGEVGGDPRLKAVLVGGAGFVGSATASGLLARGWEVTVVDVTPPPADLLDRGVAWQCCDLLVDDVWLPEGEVVVFVGNGDPRTRWLWHQPLQTVVTTGRLSVSSTDPPRFTGTIQVFGRTPNNVAVALSMFPTTRGVFLRCTTASSTPPASSTAGQPC